MQAKSDEKEFIVPPKLALAYTNIKLISETASYKVFEAETQNTLEKHLIRILNPNKDFVANNFDHVVTLFLQELFHLQNRFPGSVLINTLEINTDRKQIACAIRLSGLLSLQLDEIQQFVDLKNPKVVEKLLNDIITDVEFLCGDLQLKNVASILEPENIYYLKEKGDFFLGNWDKIFEKIYGEPANLSPAVIIPVGKALSSQDLAAEIQALAHTLLKVKRVDLEELEFLLTAPKIKVSTYNSAVKSVVEEGFSYSKELQALVERMLSRDPQNLPKLEEFKIKDYKFQGPIEEIKKDDENEQQALHMQEMNEESKINSSVIELVAPKLLAWCTYNSNKINIVDIESKQSYTNFEGVKISDTGYSWTHVKDMPKTNLLASLHHNYGKSANIEIFDISERDQIKKVYSLGEVTGVTGVGDVTYNSRRGILGAIPVKSMIAYHLFTIDAGASNESNPVKLTRKSKWYSQYTNYICGLDFNPTGESVATIDATGVCLISDINTDSYSFHQQIGTKADGYAHCRWSTESSEPLLYVKYEGSKLNILDVEKKARTLPDSILINKPGYDALWIDVCQSNGNLLAAGGNGSGYRIFDKRASKIVKTFENVHKNTIYCGRWSPSGDVIASASYDNTAKILDFKTGKLLFTGSTPDANAAMSVCFI